MPISRNRPFHQGTAEPVRIARRAALFLLLGLNPAVAPSSFAFAQDAQAQEATAAHPYADHVAEASQRFGIPEAWIRAVMRAESAGDPHATSPKGAMGLMQIMPRTWAELRLRHGLGEDPYDPRDNVLAGAAYLRELHDQYGAPGFLAAYNAGPGRYEEHLATGRPLPEETRAYVAALAPVVAGGHVEGAGARASDADTWMHAPVFVAQSANMPNADELSVNVQQEGGPASVPVVDMSALAPQSDGLFVRTGGPEPPR